MQKILLLFALLGLSLTLYGQLPPPSPCPNNGTTPAFSSSCVGSCLMCDINGVSGSNMLPGPGQLPDDMCPGQEISPHNVQWVGFTAGTSNVVLDVTVSNCVGTDPMADGLQMGIYSTLDCNNTTLVSNCLYQVTEGTTVQLGMGGLQVGGIYFLVIDGFSGDICDFTINVSSGSTVAPPITQAPQINGPSTACPGETIFFSVTTPSPGAGFYEWTVNGIPTAYDLVASLSMPNLPAGSMVTVCATPSSPCESGPPACQTVTLQNPPPIQVTEVICVEDFPATYTDPFGNPQLVPGPGNYTFQSADATGCLQTVELTVTPSGSLTPTFDFAQICLGDPVNGFHWVGVPGSPGAQIFTGPQTNTEVNLQTAANCDSTVFLTLTAFDPTIINIDTVLCEGESITVSGETFTEAGFFQILRDDVNPNGCDSIYFVQVQTTTVPPLVTVAPTICEGDTYVATDAHGSFFPISTPGSYDVLLYTVNGACDSMVRVNLSVYDPMTDLGELTICDGDTVFVGGVPFTSDTLNAEVILPTQVQQCDSTLLFSVTVLPTYNEEIFDTICAGESVLFDGIERTTTGTYAVSFPTVDNCDSTVTLNLTVQDTSFTFIQETICFGDSIVIGSTSHTTTGVYDQVFSNISGCDSTVRLDLTVRDEIVTDLVETVCFDGTYSVGDSTYNASGNYTNILTSVNGCDSTVNLSLTLRPQPLDTIDVRICENATPYTNAGQSFSSSGQYDIVIVDGNNCDSTLTVNLTVVPPVDTTFTAFICSGSIYTVGTTDFNTAGDYTVDLNTGEGCDSTVFLTLVVSDTIRTPEVASICEGDSYPFNGTDYTESGTYQSPTFLTSEGCDSVSILTLTVVPTRDTLLTVSLCEGESYTVGNDTYDATGVYTNTFTSVETNCDSIVTLDLTIRPVPVTPLVVTICDGESQEVGSSTYTTTGMYSDTLTAVNGCDSIINLDLTVNPVPRTDLVESICDGETYMVGTSSYTTSGNYMDTLGAANGCDSIVTLDLTVLPVPVTDLVEAICASETFMVGNSAYNTTGVFADTLVAANGCDSIVNLNLTVNPEPITNLVASICDSGSYTVGDSTYTLAGNYTNILTTVAGCDSTVNLELSVTDFYEINLNETICEGGSVSVGDSTYTTTGQYQNSFVATDGCDSIVNLNLTVNPILMTDLNEQICDTDSFTVGTSVYFTSGLYSDTLSSVVTGCDSIVNLDLLVNPLIFDTLNPVICEGDVFMLGTTPLGVAGTYSETYSSALTGCDSTVVVNLMVNPTLDTTLNITICDDSDYTIGNSTYNETGTYMETLSSAITGCDSIVTLNLTVNPTPDVTLNESICRGTSYMVGDSTFTESGTYMVTMPSSQQCDSTVTLNLTVFDITTDLVEVICEGESYIVGSSTFTTSGDYTVPLVTAEGCDSTVNLSLTVNPVFSVTLDEDICDNASFQVGGEFFSDPGTYVVALQTASNCDSIVTLNLTTHPCDIQGLTTPSSTQCFNSVDGSIGFEMTRGTPPYSYTWAGVGQSGDGQIEGNNLMINLEGLSPGAYTIDVVDDYGITASFTAVVTAPAPIEIELVAESLGGFNVSCPGETDGAISANVAGGSPGYTYLWSSGGQSSNINGLSEGTYALTVSDANGCQTEATVTLIAPEPVSAEITGINQGCFEDIAGRIEVAQPDGGVGPFMYQIDGSAFTSSPVFSSLETGDYTIGVLDANGCVYEELVTVPEVPELTVNINESNNGELELRYGEIVDLSLTTSYDVEQYIWTAQDTSLSCTDCVNPTLTATNTQAYSIEVVDANGCTATDRVLVVVRKTQDIFIPNAFSPNDDGFNDYFMVQDGGDVVKVKSFQVFNRWGELLYSRKNLESNVETDGWDGKHRGEPMNTGVYIYSIEVEFLGGVTEILTGDVLLKR